MGKPHEYAAATSRDYAISYLLITYHVGVFVTLPFFAAYAYMHSTEPDAIQAIAPAFMEALLPAVLWPFSLVHMLM